jgi:hypothetical protein
MQRNKQFVVCLCIAQFTNCCQYACWSAWLRIIVIILHGVLYNTLAVVLLERLFYKVKSCQLEPFRKQDRKLKYKDYRPLNWLSASILIEYWVRQQIQVPVVQTVLWLVKADYASFLMEQTVLAVLLASLLAWWALHQSMAGYLHMHV